MTDTSKATRDIIIQTRDWAEALKFYGQTLGLPVAHKSPDRVGFETGAFCLVVEKGDRKGPVLDFIVPDVQAAKVRMVGEGCVVVDEDPTVPRCYLRDPYGLVFNLGLAQASG